MALWSNTDANTSAPKYAPSLVQLSPTQNNVNLMYGNTCPYYHVDLTVCSPQWANGGPYRAVAELNPNFWEFSTIPSNNGLTILRKKYSSKY